MNKIKKGLGRGLSSLIGDSEIKNSNEKVLAIGDNLRTDIKGANNLNLDCIFITNGVHRGEYKDTSELDILLKKYKVRANFYQKEFQW